MTPVALIVVALTAAPAAERPQWRGPNRDGKSPATGLTKEWPADGPKLAWKNDNVGPGYGSPVIVGGKMYLVGAEGKKAGAKEFVLCLSVADGAEVWKAPIDTAEAKFLDGWGGGPRSTPTIDGDKLYALGASGDLVCMTLADGKPVWSVNLVKKFGGKVPTWGYSESPLIDGDNLICTPGKGTGMVALNKKTGEAVWECKDLTDDAGYSSVIPTVAGGVRQYLQQTMANAVSVRASDGKLLWKSGDMPVGGAAPMGDKKGRGPGMRSVAVIPTPVVADGYAFWCECFKLAPGGDGTKAERVYGRYKTLQNHHGGVIQVGDHVYGHSDAGGWTCLAFKQAKDEAVWQSGKLGKGSITFADGHFYCYAENDGTLAKIVATPDGWQEVGRFKIPAPSDERKGTQGKVWPHPVIAEGKLFLRDFEKLYVYDIAGKL